MCAAVVPRYPLQVGERSAPPVHPRRRESRGDLVRSSRRYRVLAALFLAVGCGSETSSVPGGGGPIDMPPATDGGGARPGADATSGGDGAGSADASAVGDAPSS